MNNRKKTNGRAFGTTKRKYVIGFTVAAKQINEKGKKTNNTFSRFIPVEFEHGKMDTQLPTSAIKRLKLKNVNNAIINAKTRASVVADSQEFDCIIIERTKYKDIHYKQN